MECVCSFLIGYNGSGYFEEWRAKAACAPRIGEKVVMREPFRSLSKENPVPGVATKTFKVVDVIHAYVHPKYEMEVISVYLEQQGETIIDTETRGKDRLAGR